MSSLVQESDLLNTSSAEPGATHNNEIGETSDSSDNNDKSIAATAESKSPMFAFKMLNFCKEITLMVFIVVVYAALTNESPPKVSKSPAAYPFFPKDSLITDWYRGQITEAIEEARSSDIAFVMFYAPWDAESQTARKQFELAAKFMHEKVAFSSINCWQPNSECKRQYSKVYKWPVLIAYPTHGRGIQYNGPLEAFHMIKFLQNICKPIIRPCSVEDLFGKYDTIVAASVDALPGSYEYAVFYSTALRFLERDPFGDIVFAVMPQKKTISPNIRLYMWNGTIDYEEEWNPDALTSWILKNLKQIAGWIAPTGAKSLTLAGFLQPGPTLILFTPKNPLLPEVDYFNMLREIAYEYHNCQNQAEIAIKQKLVGLERLKSYKNYQKVKRKCLQEMKRPKYVITNVPGMWTNSSWKDICHCVNSDSLNRVCNERDAYLSQEYLEKPKTEECQEFLLAREYGSAIFEKNVTSNGEFNVTGSSCESNLTLAFIALDSLRFYHFAEKLGINLMSLSEKSAVVIVNEEMETHHVMEEPLTSTNLRLFIQNFTKRTLSRSLRSRVRLKTKSNHIYPHLNCSQQNFFCILELTSANFLDTIMQPNKVVILFYYSKHCSFCNGISYAFLTTAKMLSSVRDIVFVRIDGDTNLLPWEYTMETYPTVLFIPPTRKSESRALSKSIPITVPNLIGFILTNVRPVLKLKTMWSVCCQSKFVDEKLQCIKSVRVETLSVTNKTLKEWRSSTRKQKVLYKLQILRHLHLLLAHSPNKTSDIQTYLNKLKE